MKRLKDYLPLSWTGCVLCMGDALISSPWPLNMTSHWKSMGVDLFAISIPPTRAIFFPHLQEPLTSVEQRKLSTLLLTLWTLCRGQALCHVSALTQWGSRKAHLCRHLLPHPSVAGRKGDGRTFELEGSLVIIYSNTITLEMKKGCDLLPVINIPNMIYYCSSYLKIA